MKRCIVRWVPARRNRGPVAVLAAGVAAAASLTVAACSGSSTAAPAAQSQGPAESTGLGQLTGMLPASHLNEPSVIDVNFSNETVRFPLYPGTAYAGTSHAEKVWYVLLDSSDAGAAKDLGVNYAPKLANIAVSDPAAVQTVTLTGPSVAQNPFGPAPLNFAGAPDFSPTRVAVPGPHGFPLAKFAPGAVAGPGYSPFIKIAGSGTVYNAPIVATGNGPYDVVHHTNTADRALGIHIAGPSKPGQFAESYADMLFVKGFDAGQPIVYMSTDAGEPLTAVLERSIYVPALHQASCNGCDDFAGSARERLFGFINGQTGTGDKQAQGFQHLALDGAVGQDASLGNTALINALRNGGDLLNVFGDYPTEADPRHALAYSPLWDAQLGLWTPKAVQQKMNTRQIDENVTFNLAATRPDLITGVNPATGQPEPYGSAGVDINCVVIGYPNKAPTANLQPPVPGSQFPPRG